MTKERYWAVKAAKSHLDPPNDWLAAIFLTGLLEVFIFEISILVAKSSSILKKIANCLTMVDLFRNFGKICCP